MKHSVIRLQSASFTGLMLLTSSMLAVMARAGDDSQRPSSLEEIIVTAQKRVANLQQVPASVQALDAKKLEELHVESFDGYMKFLPSLSSQNSGPGHEQLFIRGVTNGTDGLAVGSQPTVAVYLDEQPVTTIGENLDVHIYDVARVEELSGPQGTLFGASSMAGTLRIITNKPSTMGFQAALNLDASTVTGVPGSIAEGFVNLPLSDQAAIRLVGFTEHDGGYINNVLGPPGVYPTSGAVRSNAAVVEKHFNGVDTAGGRAALKINLGNSWTVTPSVMLQHQKSHGVPGYEPVRGDLNVSVYTLQSDLDRWWQAAMTVEGKIGNLDVVYADGYINRSVDSQGDFADYSYYYDQYFGHYFGDQFHNDAGAPINPLMTISSVDRFTKVSHELRLSSPQDWRLRFVAGLFLQHQIDDTRNEIRVDGLARASSITGLPGVQYLNAMSRVDRDRALFGEVSYDFTPRLALTGGLRWFAYDNSVYGFFGYNSGEALCQTGSAAFAGPDRPCIDVDQRDTGTGSTYSLNLKYQLRTGRMLYLAWSTGFRPGGINRTRDAATYHPDYLSNFEAGVKTSWLAHRLRFNAALFFEPWKDPQYTICGPNCVYEVINAGAAEIRGVESQLQWIAADGLTLSASVTWLNARLTENACRYGNAGSLCDNATGVADPSILPAATAGAPLPVPRVKGNVTVRCTFRIGDFEAHAQAAAFAQSAVRAPPMPAPGFGSLDLSGDLGHSNWTTELYVKNLFDERGPQGEFRLCGVPGCPLAEIPIAPRTIGIRFGQKF